MSLTAHPPAEQAGFELLFERHPLPMWVFDDASLEFLAVNEAAVAKFGYFEAEFMKMTLEQILHPEDIKVLDEYRAASVAAVVNGGKEALPPAMWRAVCKDGRIIDVESTWDSIPFRERMGVMSVITDRIDAKRAAEKNREQARLLDLASDAIVVCDLEGRVTFWNHGAERLYGWTAAEALGGSMVDMLMRDVSALADTEEGCREHGEWSGQLKQVSKTGAPLIVNSRWTLVHDDHGVAKSVLVINTDLTETKNLEAQFLRTQRLESIGTLASGIAHDLNNILSPILMSVGILRRSLKDADAERMLSIIESSAERGAGIVKQVLTFARGVDGERVLLQPKHLLSEMSKILAQTFPRNIDIQTTFSTDLWTVTGDATQLHQVLLNLAVNARDAMPEGGTLTLAAENMEVDQHFARMNPNAQLGSHVALRVTDTGSGMSPETMERIFDPFFTTKEVGKGTGLGLATVMGIVKSHGGFLTVQSEIGLGTTFQILLPASGASIAVAEGQREQSDIIRGNGELVLVVDDEPPIREALVQTLQDFGYRAYTAEDGSDALALYQMRKGEFSVVLTDLAMGQMDGVSLVRALRKVDPKVRVIVSSGHCQKENAIALEAMGVKSFLDKPYNAGKLLRALREVLDAA